MERVADPQPTPAALRETMTPRQQVETLLSGVRRHERAGESQAARECCAAIIDVVDRLEREKIKLLRAHYDLRADLASARGEIEDARRDIARLLDEVRHGTV